MSNSNSNGGAIAPAYPPGLRAITTHAPFAYAQILGIDDAEIRKRATNYRGWLLIHCGKATGSDEAFKHYQFPPTLKIERGSIIGAVKLNDCWQDEKGFWFYEYENAVRFARTYPIKGKQQTLWLPSGSAELAVFKACWSEINKMSNHTASN